MTRITRTRTGSKRTARSQIGQRSQRFAAIDAALPGATRIRDETVSIHPRKRMKPGKPGLYQNPTKEAKCYSALSMTSPSVDPSALFERALASGRIHSSYLLAGPAEDVRIAAREFARGLVCSGDAERPCEACRECRRSSETDKEIVELDGSGKSGPLYRHIGDHPDLYWIDRGAAGTRVRIGQVRALQHALHFGANEGGWRAAVIADADWLNQEAQNSLLKLLEEPPDRTCVILAGTSTAPLAATIRSRCQRVRLPACPRKDFRGDDVADNEAEIVARLDRICAHSLPELLDWAEDYRGNRASAADKLQTLLAVAAGWLGAEVRRAVYGGQEDVRGELDALRALASCRRDLVQRNANPQMVAERALFAVREARTV